MLEVTILKVEHQGSTEARKLLPYIQQCDVFGPESAFLLETDAAYTEKNWADVIKSDISRTQFMKYSSDMIGKTEKNPGIIAYKLKIYDYLFREKKPIWHPERYSENERKIILAPTAEGTRLDRLLFSCLMADKIDEFFDYAWKSFGIQNTQTVQRDQHIAKQLALAETRIKNHYTELAKKDPLKYALFVGLAHEPEKYIDHPVSVVDLSNSLMTPLKRMQNSLLTGDKSEESKRNMATWIYLTLFKGKGASREQIEQMNLTQLIALLKKDLNRS